jgi:hypothetical protein
LLIDAEILILFLGIILDMHEMPNKDQFYN